MSYTTAKIQAPAATTWTVTPSGFSFVAPVNTTGYIDSTGLAVANRGSQIAQSTNIGVGPFANPNVVPLVTASPNVGVGAVVALPHGLISTVVLQDIDVSSALPHVGLANYALQTFGVRYDGINVTGSDEIFLNFGFGENSYSTPDHPILKAGS